MTNLEVIAAAAEEAGRRTPPTVLEAFAGATPRVFGRPIRPVSLGAWIAFEMIGHPFVMGNEAVEMYDFACALYILSAPSEEVLDAIQAGTFRHQVLQVADAVQVTDLEVSLDLLKSHLAKAFGTAMPMRQPGEAQKKTADSDSS